MSGTIGGGIGGVTGSGTYSDSSSPGVVGVG